MRIIDKAVAGSGKTTRIQEYLAGLIRDGTHPSQIFCCTFTKKMAGELKERLNGMPNIDTIHGMCLRIISEHKEVIGYERIIMIDENLETSIIKGIIYDCGLKKITLKSFRSHVALFLAGKGIIDRSLSNAVNVYMQKMKGYGYISYDMCENFALYIIKQIGLKVKYLIVDEFQDSSALEYDIVINYGENIYVAGDRMQSIYSFRGAEPSILESFQQGADSVRNSNQSWRCPLSICKVANVIIKEESGSGALMLSSQNSPVNVPVDFVDMYVTPIEGVVAKYLKFYSPRDIIVLARTNASIAQIVQDTMALPIDREFIQLSKSSAFSRLNAALMAYHNGYPRPLLIHLLTVLKIDQKTIFSIDRTSAGNLYANVKDMPEIKNINAILNSDRNCFIDKCAMILRILEAFPGEFEKYGDAILSFIKASTIDEYMDWYMNNFTQNFFSKDKVSLLTVHGAKGLEAECVIVTDIEDGKFPHKKASIDEELRLLYVACTRAKTQLVLHHGNSNIIQKIKENI